MYNIQCLIQHVNLMGVSLHTAQVFHNSERCLKSAALSSQDILLGMPCAQEPAAVHSLQLSLGGSCS